MRHIEVDWASEAEAPACAALLAQARSVGAEYLIARLEGELAGAAAVLWRDGPSGLGFPLLVEVVPALRRLGVGRALVEAAARLVDGEIDGLQAWTALADDSPGACLARSCGFEGVHPLLGYEVELGEMERRLQPLMARLSQRQGAGDAAFQTGPLREADAQEVARLITFQLGGDPLLAALRLERDLARSHSEIGPAQVVTRNGELVGAMIWRAKGELCLVDARVVAPGWRGTPANHILTMTNLRKAGEMGLRSIRFDCTADNHDTIRLAVRSGGRQVETRMVYSRGF